MNNSQQSKCICTTQGYAPDCPQAFMQNGTLMHTLSGENQLKPRCYDTPEPLRAPHLESVVTSNSKDDRERELEELYNDHSINRNDNDAALQNEQNLARDYGRSNMQVDSFRNRAETRADYTWATDTDMKQANRKELPNFNPLRYQGMTMTEATIGGFRLNMEVAQKKATEFVPLPPVFLPMIFVDKDLNFSHHFFQGMDILLGKKYMERIVRQEKYSESDSKKILPALKQLIMAGAKPGDTELTMFVKRVLSGTFDTLPEASIIPEQDELIVAVNMWGFQYLEPSMRCRDADLRMWLHMSHMKYKVSWFNAFKSSGIPKFALSGVQDRYESRGDEQLRGFQNGLTDRTETFRPRRSRTEGATRSSPTRTPRESGNREKFLSRIFT
jgi:hypothetical protein